MEKPPARVRARTAVIEGNLSKFRSLYSAFSLDLHEFLPLAAEHGRQNIVEYLIRKGKFTKEQLDEALAEAAAQNHLEIFNYLREHGADNIDLALIAAVNSEPETVRYLLSLHPSDDAILVAIQATESIVDLENFLGAGNFNINSEEIKEFLRDAVENDDWMALESFLKYGYLPFIDDFIKLYSDEPDEMDSILEIVLLRSKESPEDWEYYTELFDELYLYFKDDKEVQTRVKQLQRRLKGMELLV